MRTLKREGDGATPLGTWPILWAYYRPDKVMRPRTATPLHPIRQDAGWCDEPEDRNYNRPVRLPYKASTERLWRGDGLYDLVAVIGYNVKPRSNGRGSAIFLHAAQPNFDPTAGCIAISLQHLLRLLAALRPRTSVAVGKNLPHRPQRGRRGLR
ncbi:MAG: L,D-transpeptidase family protein [Rhodomicrobium sp.]